VLPENKINFECDAVSLAE